MEINTNIPIQQSPISIALEGIKEQREQLAGLSQEIASGNVTPENIVELKESLLYTKALAKVLEVSLENEHRIIDILV
jgi:hypothetical protein